MRTVFVTKDRQTETERYRQTYGERERDRDRERDTHTHRDRERQREKEREQGSGVGRSVMGRWLAWGGGGGDRITSFSRCVALNPRHIKTASSVSRSAHNPVHRLSCTSDIHAGCGEKEAREKRESHRRCSLPSRNCHDRKHPRKASEVFFTFPLSSSLLYLNCLSVAKSCCQAKHPSAPKNVWEKKKKKETKRK